jgi:hypothetical protein
MKLEKQKKNCAKAKGTVTVAFSIKRTIKNLNSSELFIRLNIDYITNYAMYFFVL